VAKFNETFLPASEDVDVEEIYDGCLYRPTADVLDSKIEDLTFEALNGGLTGNNIDLSSGKLTSEHFRSGTFARGYSYGFNFPDRYHEAQFSKDPELPEKLGYITEVIASGDTDEKWFTPSYSMCSTVFIPWNAVVYVSYQGFFAGDYKNEYINKVQDRSYTHLYVDGVKQTGTRCTIPAARKDEKVPHEDFFRWNHKARVLHLEKGYHTFNTMVYQFMVSASLSTGAQRKLHNFCGSISILAIKSGYDHNVTSFKEWHGADVTFDDPPRPPPQLS